MTKSTRSIVLAAAAATVTLIAAPVTAAPTSVSNGPVTAHAKILKPLTLTKDSDMDFGAIVDQSGGTITMDTGGNLTCTAGLTCATTGTPAKYTVNGTNSQVVNVTMPDVTLTNATNPGTDLTLTLAGPAQVTLPNSGTAGVDFTLGGSIIVGATTNDGLYTGDLDVTVQYN